MNLRKGQINFLENIPNISEGKKNEIRMNKSVLDFRNENDWNNKEKDLNDFIKKQKKKKKDVTDKINNRNINIKNNENNLNYIKNFFCKKGINVTNIHKNTFGKGKKYNTINLKIIDNNNNKMVK